MRFDHIEYLGGAAVPVIGSDLFSGSSPTGQPIWKMSGTADYQMDFTVEGFVFSVEGTGQQTVSNCAGTATYKVDARVYPDVVLDLR